MTVSASFMLKKECSTAYFGYTEILLFGFRSLCAVFGTSLQSVVYTCGIKGSSYDVVSYAGKVFDSAASDQNHTVLLQVMADTWNICSDFDSVGQTNSGNLSQR